MRTARRASPPAKRCPFVPFFPSSAVAPAIPVQSGWWSGDGSHYNPPELSYRTLGGINDGRTRKSENIAGTSSAGRASRPRAVRLSLCAGACCWRLSSQTASGRRAARCGSLGAAGRNAPGRERSPSAMARSPSRGRWASRPTSPARCGSTATPARSRKLVVQQRSPRSYDGVDLLVTAAAAQIAGATFGRRRRSSSRTPIEMPLADLSGEFVNKQLDRRGNRLLVMRSPGDLLRVSLARDSLVFGPGETVQVHARAARLPLPEGGRARMKIQLLGGGKELWSQQRDVQAGTAIEHPPGNPLAERRGRLRHRDRGGEQSAIGRRRSGSR